MKIFVINRKQDVARRDAIASRLNVLGCAFELVEAVDGHALDETAKRALADVVKMRRVLRVMSDGEIGCAASHLAVYRRMIAEKIESACILEDDARLSEQFASAVETTLGSGPRVVLLTDRQYGMIWTIGYLINRAAAKVMLCYNSPIWRVADCWESLARRGRLRVSWSEAALIEPDRAWSSVITPEGTPPHQIPLPGDRWSIAKRTFWRLMYGIGLKV